MVYPTPRRLGEYGTYKSVYGPKYHYQMNLFGMAPKQLWRLGFHTASFGGAAVIALLLYTSGIPRIKTDILAKIPIVGKYTQKPEVHPADNPF